MTDEELIFFQRLPEMLPVYERLKRRLDSAYPDMGVKVSKTQISLKNRHVFAAVSLPRLGRRNMFWFPLAWAGDWKTPG